MRCGQTADPPPIIDLRGVIEPAGGVGSRWRGRASSWSKVADLAERCVIHRIRDRRTRGRRGKGQSRRCTPPSCPRRLPPTGGPRPSVDRPRGRRSDRSPRSIRSWNEPTRIGTMVKSRRPASKCAGGKPTWNSTECSVRPTSSSSNRCAPGQGGRSQIDQRIDRSWPIPRGVWKSLRVKAEALAAILVGHAQDDEDVSASDLSNEFPVSPGIELVPPRPKSICGTQDGSQAAGCSIGLGVDRPSIPAPFGMLEDTSGQVGAEGVGRGG